MLNKIKRDIPRHIDNYGDAKPYAGPFETKPEGQRMSPTIVASKPMDDKMVSNIREALEKAEVRDGMTISFHHHLRNGDFILNTVLEQLAAMDIKDITIFASSLTNAHEPLIEHIKNGVVTGLNTSGLRGAIGKAQAEENILGKPVVFRTHGGRARAIESGEVKIDIAFIGAPACDEMGNMNGMEGKSAFGAMGYPIVDAQYADKVIAITDNLMPFPLNKISIPMTLVDYVVVVDSIGDPKKDSIGSHKGYKESY